MVGGQYKYAAVQPVQIPRLAVAQVFIEHQRLVLSQYAHSIYAGIDTVGKGEIDDAVFAAKGHRGLGQLFGKGVQPTALAARQQHGHPFFLHEHLMSLLLGVDRFQYHAAERRHIQRDAVCPLAQRLFLAAVQRFPVKSRAAILLFLAAQGHPVGTGLRHAHTVVLPPAGGKVAQHQ